LDIFAEQIIFARYRSIHTLRLEKMMESTKKLDVLVVYSGNTAASANNQDPRVNSPFPAHRGQANYNQSYAYFLKQCRQQGLAAGFSTSDDITGPGTCDSYWKYARGQWDKNDHNCYAEDIFDKLSPTSDAKIVSRKLLFSSPDIRPFNSSALSLLFTDKLQTYRRLPDYSIPTVALTDTSHRGIKQALKSLSLLVKNHPHTIDFDSAIFLKDRYGAGGEDIHKIDSNHAKTIQQITNKHSELSYILQPAVLYDQGFRYQGKPALTDIRLIFQNNKLIQSYIRIAKPGSYLCNEHQGGELIYLDLAKIPPSVVKTGKKIAGELNQLHSLYALDFVISNHGQVFLLEGNTGPGIDWNSKKPQNERMSKQLIAGIVQEFASRVTPDENPPLTQRVDPLQSQSEFFFPQ
jgi:glutathione synthase/RimK-type ligase-like ATP-grasp enzyme